MTGRMSGNQRAAGEERGRANSNIGWRASEIRSPLSPHNYLASRKREEKETQLSFPISVGNTQRVSVVQSAGRLDWDNYRIISPSDDPGLIPL